ncbi:hypothetical protein V1L52_02335 [Treponema sp. HNW]|uniref:hypothetical protein n=1 Tax=Treponema sp. HNW TaxID=3116654 RepID=UPI003D0CB245
MKVKSDIIQKNERLFSLLRPLSVLGFLAAFSVLYAQNEAAYEILRFPLWFPVDNVPSLQKPLEKGDSIYTQAIEEIKALTPFMLEGLIYGWKFSYTPSDKLRGVSEFFSVEALIPIASDERLSFTDVHYRSEGARLECWAEYRLSPDMIHRRERYKTSAYRSIHGKGEAPLIDGGEGIKEACRQALKDAVRSYARTFVKNKPKEINGTVLLTDLPRYYIKSGKYRADLDFFLFVSKIEEYTQF